MSRIAKAILFLVLAVLFAAAGLVFAGKATGNKTYVASTAKNDPESEGCQANALIKAQFDTGLGPAIAGTDGNGTCVIFPIFDCLGNDYVLMAYSINNETVYEEMLNLRGQLYDECRTKAADNSTIKDREGHQVTGKMYPIEYFVYNSDIPEVHDKALAYAQQLYLDKNTGNQNLYGPEYVTSFNEGTMLLYIDGTEALPQGFTWQKGAVILLFGLSLVFFVIFGINTYKVVINGEL